MRKHYAKNEEVLLDSISSSKNNASISNYVSHIILFEHELSMDRFARLDFIVHTYTHHQCVGEIEKRKEIRMCITVEINFERMKRRKEVERPTASIWISFQGTIIKCGVFFFVCLFTNVCVFLSYLCTHFK